MSDGISDQQSSYKFFNVCQRKYSWSLDVLIQIIASFLPSGELPELVDILLDLKIMGAESANINRALSFEEYLESQQNFVETNIPINWFDMKYIH